MKLINKDAVVAWIRNKLLPTVNSHADEWESGENNERINILNFINSLEVKEIDLDTEIMKYMTEHFNVYEDGVLESKKSETPLSTYDILVAAKHFFELGLKVSTGEKPVRKVWHDASEEPNMNSMIFYKRNGCVPDVGRFLGVAVIEGHFSWEIFKYPQSIIVNNIEKWALVDELLKIDDT